MFLRVLFLVAPLLASGELRPFRCNSSDEVRDLRIKQVFIVDDQVYLLREKQSIVFPHPVCFFNSEKQIVCAISPAFELENEFQFQRAAEWKLKGW